jgi:hypothetical protein
MSKMASHEPFGHLQPKLWAKEGSGIKLTVSLPTTKSRESTSPRRLQKECDKALENYRGELQLWFRPHSNRRSELGNMSSQSLGSPTRDSFGTPPWESREKNAIRMWFPRSNAKNTIWGKAVASPESGPWWVKWVQGRPCLSQHQKGAEWVITNLWLVLDAGPCNNIIIFLPSLIPGLLAHPSYPL